MVKWILRLLLIAVIGFVGYLTYEQYRGGFFSLPDLPEGAYTLSFRNGLRAIVLDAEVSDPSMAGGHKFFRGLASANSDRRYIGVPFEVAPWFRDAWSFCTAPTESERESFRNEMPASFRQSLANARLDGVCRINVDGDEIVRGLVYSVPKL